MDRFRTHSLIGSRLSRCVWILMVMPLLACSDREVTERSASNVISVLYEGSEHPKPGADIQFHYEYDGFTRVGERERILLNLSSATETGTLAVALHLQDGLQLLSTKTQWQFDLSKQSSVEVPVEVVALAGGRYYLSIVASVRHADGSSSVRSFGLPVDVNENQTLTKGRTVGKMILTPEGESIIVMPSLEDEF